MNQLLKGPTGERVALYERHQKMQSSRLVHGIGEGHYWREGTSSALRHIPGSLSDRCRGGLRDGEAMALPYWRVVQACLRKIEEGYSLVVLKPELVKILDVGVVM